MGRYSSIRKCKSDDKELLSHEPPQRRYRRPTVMNAGDRQPPDLSMTTVITTVCTTVHGGGRRITRRSLQSPYTTWTLGINLGRHSWWQAPKGTLTGPSTEDTAPTGSALPFSSISPTLLNPYTTFIKLATSLFPCVATSSSRGWLPRAGYQSTEAQQAPLSSVAYLCLSSPALFALWGKSFSFVLRTWSWSVLCQLGEHT